MHAAYVSYIDCVFNIIQKTKKDITSNDSSYLNILKHANVDFNYKFKDLFDFIVINILADFEKTLKKCCLLIF